MPQSSSANPYENPYPVEHPALLYGRHEVLQRIFRRLFWTEPPPSLQLTGLARYGKSSVLNVISCLNDPRYSDHFMQEFGLERERLKNTLVVHVNCAGLSINDSSQFWNLMNQQLTRALSASLNKTDIQQGGITFEDFSRRLFDLKKYKLLVFLFDAFERIVRQAYIDVSHNLRFLLEESKGRLAYITATPRTLYDYYKVRADAKDMAPLFSYFDPEPIYLGSLESEGVRNFIKTPSANNGVTFSNEDIEFVLNKGGQHPDLIRLLCKYLFDHRISSPDKKIAYVALYEQLERYFEPFCNLIKKELSETQLQALVHVAIYSNVREIPGRVQDELIKLGLLIHDPEKNQFHIFSEVFSNFLSKEEPVETKPVRFENEPEQRGASSVSNQEASSPPTMKVWERRRSVQVGDKLERLSPNEWKLFTYLWDHANQVCTRNELISALSSTDAEFTGAALDITISRLRQKIEPEPDKPRSIITVRGRGYRFEEHGTITVVR